MSYSFPKASKYEFKDYKDLRFSSIIFLGALAKRSGWTNF